MTSLPNGDVEDVLDAEQAAPEVVLQQVVGSN